MEYFFSRLKGHIWTVELSATNFKIKLGRLYLLLQQAAKHDVNYIKCLKQILPCLFKLKQTNVTVNVA